MNQGGYVTLVGYVAREPTLRATKEGTLVADMRIGTASRYFDKGTGQWQDGDSSYFTVTCWRRLATAAKISLRKGEPVIIRGRFRTRAFVDREGQARTEIEITAEAFGHDLTRGVATFVQRGMPPDGVLRPRRPNGGTEGETDQAEAGQGEAGEGEGVAGGGEAGQGETGEGAGCPEDEEGDGGAVGADAPLPYGMPPAGATADELLNEPAIARFAEDLTDSGAMERELEGGEPEAGDPVEAVAAR